MARIVGDVPIVEEVLLNTLLQPAGRHPIDRRRLLRFAHQSFLDWFLARAIADRELKASSLSTVTERFLADIRSALQQGEALP